MSDKWEIVKRKADEHVCSRPGHGYGFTVGDIVRCKECGQHWTLERIEHGMQWDPIVPPALMWKRT